MSRRDSASPTERTPTPASEARPTTASDPRTVFRRRFGAAFTEMIEGLDLAMCTEIQGRYGDDPEREIADISVGRHPLQRDGRNLDAYPRYEAKLAAVRAKLA